MSEYGVEGPPEQETDMTKANTHANDKWAQDRTHGPKGKVGGPTGRPADLPGRPTCPWAPPTQTCHVEEAYWMPTSVWIGSAADEAPLGRGSLL